MADRYWVGGTGTWDSTSTANWAATSGGAGGASVPTAADNVIFDAGSDAGGIFTVTMANSPRLCNDFTASGLDFTMTLAGTNIGLTVSGSLTFPATNFTRTYTGTTTFNATTTGKTITTNGVAFGANVTLDGVGGAWTLGSALNCGTLSTLTLTNGTFDTSASNYAVSAQAFSSSNSNTRTITLNNSILTFSTTGTGWNMATSTNATLNVGNSTINLSSSGPTFAGGNLTFYNVSFTGTAATSSAKSITGANTFNNLTVSTIASAGLNNISIDANQTINGTFTVNGAVNAGSFVVGGLYTISTVGTTDFTLIGAASNTVGVVFVATGVGSGTGTVTTSGNQRIFIRSSASGTSRTLTCAVIAAMTDVDFQDITIAGAHGTLSGTRLGDCNGNSNITFVAGATKYWNLAAGGNWSATAWALSSGGSVAAANFPLAQDTVIIENTGLNTSATITINGDWNIGTLDTSTRTNAMTLESGTTGPIFYGNFTYGSGVTPSGGSSAGYTFSNRSIKTLNSGGKTFTQPVSIVAPGGGIQLVTNNLTVVSTREINLTKGTLDLNNLTATTGAFISTENVTRTLAFGTTGQVTLTGNNGMVFRVFGAGFVSTGTFIISSNYAGSTGTRTFDFTSLRVDVKAGSAVGGVSFGTAGTDIVSVNGTVADFDTTGFSGTLANATRNVSGAFTIGSGTTLASGTSTTTFSATSGTQLITTNGKTLDFPITFSGVGGTFQLQDALTMGSTRTATLTNGTLDLNNLTLSTGLFSSSNSNTRTIAFGTGNITCTGTGTVWTTITATNLTTTGTQVVNVTSVGSTPISIHTGNALSEANSISFNITGGTYNLDFGGNTTSRARNINFTGYAGTCTLVSLSNSMTMYGNLTLSTGMSLLTASSTTLTFGATSGIQQITSNGKTMDFAITFAGVGGTFRLQDAMTLGSTRAAALTNGTLNLNNFTLTTGTFNSSYSNTRTIAFGTGNITCTGTGTVWTTATVTNLTTTGTQVVNVTSTGSTAITVETGALSEANSISYNFTGGTYALNFLHVTNYSARNVDFTGYAGTLAELSDPSAAPVIIYGDLTLSAGMTLTASTTGNGLRFGKTSGTSNITTNGKALPFILNFNGVGGTFVLQDALTVSGATSDVFLTNGTLDLNGKTFTVATLFQISAGTKNLTFNGGTLVCPLAVAIAFYNIAPTGFTTTAGTGTGTISMTAAGSKGFVGGGSIYNCTLNQGGAGALTIFGSNTFSNITNTYKSTGATSILFTAGDTNTFTNWNASGESGRLLTIGSTTAASHTLSKSSGTVSVSFCSISRSNATGGATWEALTPNGNVDGGNNTGWIFGAGAPLTGNFLMFF